MIDKGDVLLYQTDDDGEMNIANGTTEMSSGLETAAYISLFGGNEQDPGEADTRDTWWGNLSETEPVNQYRSKTQYLLRSLPVTSSNLKRIEAAAIDDLSWFLNSGVATDLSVVVTIPARNRVSISVSIVADGNEIDFIFVENWEQAA